MIVKTQDTDGLTWSQLKSEPATQVKYTMDNSEVYRGLRDLASLMTALNDPTSASNYNAAADRVQQGIVDNLWDTVNNHWYWGKDNQGGVGHANIAGEWYPDAACQLFPVIYGVVSLSDSKAVLAYNALNSGQPAWDTLQFNDPPFPWVVIGYGAALMGDTKRVNTYISTIDSQIVNAGFPSTNWYDAEAGWFIRLNARIVNTAAAVSVITDYLLN